LKIRLEYNGCLDNQILTSGCNEGSPWWVLVGPNSGSVIMFVLPREDIRQHIQDVGTFRFILPLTRDFVHLPTNWSLGADSSFPVIFRKTVYMDIGFGGPDLCAVLPNRMAASSRECSVSGAFITWPEMVVFCSDVADQICSQMAAFAEGFLQGRSRT